MYKLYLRPHLDYGDIIYHKHDPDLKLDFTKKIRILPSTQPHLPLAELGVEQVDRSFMMNLVRRVSITGDDTVE